MKKCKAPFLFRHCDHFTLKTGGKLATSEGNIA